MYRLILKLFEITRDFPRDYKYTLGQDFKGDGIVLVRSIYLSALMVGIGRQITG